MFCTTECWNCEDKNCEHYISKQELYFENQQLKEKYLNAVADYETTKSENQQLKDNWNELKKWLECMCEVSHLDIMCLNAVLNKMQEILDKAKGE